jgi:hypothetical protein
MTTVAKNWSVAFLAARDSWNRAPRLNMPPSAATNEWPPVCGSACFAQALAGGGERRSWDISPP